MRIASSEFVRRNHRVSRDEGRDFRVCSDLTQPRCYAGRSDTDVHESGGRQGMMAFTQNPEQ